MNTLKGILFDMDGTITLTEPLHHKAFAEVFAKFGIPYTFAQHVKSYSGAGSKMTFEDVFLKLQKPLDEKTLFECIEAKKDLYTKIIHESEIALVPGVKEFVKKIDARGLKKIIATGNANLDDVRYILEKIGLLAYFPLIVSIKEVPRGKPFPDVFLEAARRIECACSECVVLEDSLNGVAAAKAGGFRCIALETTCTKEDLLKAGATEVVKSFYEITDQILFCHSGL